MSEKNAKSKKAKVSANPVDAAAPVSEAGDELGLSMAALLVKSGATEDAVAGMSVQEIERRLRKRLAARGIPTDATAEELSTAAFLGFEVAPPAKAAKAAKGASKSKKKVKHPASSESSEGEYSPPTPQLNIFDGGSGIPAETATGATKKRKSTQDSNSAPSVPEKAVPRSKKGIKKPKALAAKKGSKVEKSKATTKVAKKKGTGSSKRGVRQAGSYFSSVAKLLDREKPILREDLLAKMEKLGMTRLTSISYLTMACRALHGKQYTKGGKEISNPFGVQVETRRSNGRLMVAKVAGSAPVDPAA